MAQPGSAPALGAGGRRFESCCPDQNLIVVSVAQLVERRIVIPVVVGSSPIVHPIIYFGRYFVLFEPNCCQIVVNLLKSCALGGSGGIGRHARFRFWCRKVWRFKSSLPYHCAVDVLHRIDLMLACLVGDFFIILSKMNSETQPSLRPRIHQ